MEDLSLDELIERKWTSSRSDQCHGDDPMHQNRLMARSSDGFSP